MIFPALITILSLILYQFFVLNVARARGKYGIKAPATTGNLDFERCYRVQMNTLEQLIVFLPSMWIFGVLWAGPLFSDFWSGQHVAATVGALWLLSRIFYARGYYINSERRYLGMSVTLLCSLFLSVGALVGIIKKILIIHPIHF